MKNRNSKTHQAGQITFVLISLIIGGNAFSQEKMKMNAMPDSLQGGSIEKEALENPGREDKLIDSNKSIDTGIYLGGRWVRRQENLEKKAPTLVKTTSEKINKTRKALSIAMTVSAVSFGLSGVIYTSISDECGPLEQFVKSPSQCAQEADNRRNSLFPILIGSAAVFTASMVWYFFFPDQ